MRPPARNLRLAGRRVRLEPLTLDAVEPLFASCGDPEVFRWVHPHRMASIDDMRVFVDVALAEAGRGSRVPLLIRDAKGQAIGSSSYLDIEPTSERLEIGATFLARTAWRTAINSECKLLLLGHAFEELGAGRVALKTDGSNLRSQAAIERLGAVREGTLRRHLVRGDGTIRDTVYYSILAEEWPTVRARLAAALAD